MTSGPWETFDDYIQQLFAPHDLALDAALRAADDAGLPSINVAPHEGKLLYLLARLARARRILEIGTLGGYSTIWLARSLPPGGRLVSLEYDAKHARVATENIARAGLADRVEVRVGRAIDNLPALAAEEPFDMVFIDADKPSYSDYLDWSLRLARPGGLIVADNVVRGGAVADPATTDASALGARAFNERLAADPRASAVIVQTIGRKGHDGMAIAIVESPGDLADRGQ